MQDDFLTYLQDGGILTELDVHFARFIAGLCDRPIPELALAAALASNATRKGHICLDLMKVGGERLVGGQNGEPAIHCPEPQEWVKKIRETPVVGVPGQRVPLVMDDDGRLYLFRYWDYQYQLICLIKERLEATEDVDFRVLRDGLERLFPSVSSATDNNATTRIDWQKVAAVLTILKRFCVISGGPGTGKTTTVANILALMLEQPGSNGMKIALTAPTGKAAARLQEAIKEFKKTVNCASTIKEQIPDNASTIHRLLGGIMGSPYFRHNHKNPLAVDVAVVDEASMVDMALMSKFVQALRPQARLILLGDKDQLASVEAGAVLGDMCDAGAEHGYSASCRDIVRKAAGVELPCEAEATGGPRIGDCLVNLKKNFRFNEGGGIARMSAAINAGDEHRTVSLLRKADLKDLGWKNLTDSRDLSQHIKKDVIKHFVDYLQADSVEEGFKLFGRFRVLCALREGPYGVAGVNSLIETLLRDEGCINRSVKWYPGRSVLINRNDYNLGLFNGDVGILWPDPEAGDLRVFFKGPQGSFKKFHPARLPEHETVFAMTVHKSQGSEFDEVVIILPDKEYPVLTRELLYTGITRARDRVEIWGPEKILRSAISRRVARTSGLRDALWGPS